VVGGGHVGHALHPVHGLDRVEPALPAPPGQVLPDPGRLQVLESVKVGGGEPGVLEALRGRQPVLGADDQQLLDLEPILWNRFGRNLI
jgi:hypothetical protein